MTHSRKKTPIIGVTAAESEKMDKQSAHRRERRKVHVALGTEASPEVMPHTREVSDRMTMAKDGKVYLGKELPLKARRK